jgi:hypothetical protein
MSITHPVKDRATVIVLAVVATTMLVLAVPLSSSGIGLKQASAASAPASSTNSTDVTAVAPPMVEHPLNPHQHHHQQHQGEHQHKQLHQHQHKQLHQQQNGGGNMTVNHHRLKSMA